MLSFSRLSRSGIAFPLQIYLDSSCVYVLLVESPLFDFFFDLLEPRHSVFFAIGDGSPPFSDCSLSGTAVAQKANVFESFLVVVLFSILVTPAHRVLML